MANETKHTPGPWIGTRRMVVERSIRINEHIAIAPRGGPTFAYVPMGRDSREDIQAANAALFTAAPEMLEALKAVYYALPPSAKLDSDLLAMISRAIAKAEGRS